METGEVIIVNGRRLRKIGERHGKKMADEFKPKPKVKKEPKPKKEPNKKLVGTKQKVLKKKVVKKDEIPSHMLSFSEKHKLLKRRKNKLKKNSTREERFFRYNLTKNSIRHKFQKGFIGRDVFMITDFYIPYIRLVIEIDGGYHDEYNQKIRDKMKDIAYAKRGLSVLRIRNEDVSRFDFNDLKSCYDNRSFTESMIRMLTVHSGVILKTRI